MAISGTLLFIIFGNKLRSKEYGEAYLGYCPHCDNDVWWHAVKFRKWFHIYWIPLIPHSADRVLVCPICGSEAGLTKEQFATATELADRVAAYRDGDESERAVEEKIREFDAQLADDEEIVDKPPGELHDGQR